jgi:hypothetical protein
VMIKIFYLVRLHQMEKYLVLVVHLITHDPQQ